MIDSRAGRSWLLVLIVAAALFPATRDADAATCGTGPGDDDAVAAFLEDASTACPCDGFSSRTTYRRCVRDHAKSAFLAGTLPSRCRSTVIRHANRSTCGSAPGAVTCCANVSTSREACTISRSDAACRAWRGRKGQVGSSEWCHDACGPEPTPTPTVTATPSGPPTPFGLGPRCMCQCAPAPSPWPSPWPNTPYAPNGCPSFHWCVVMSPVPTGQADCAALSDGSNRGCIYSPDAPDPDSPTGPVVDYCTF